MPEGPECHLTAEKLNEWCENSKINNIEFVGGRYLTHGAPKYMEKESDICKGKFTILKIYCKGKLIIWELTNNNFILNTLGMSGRWVDYKTNHCDVCFEIKNNVGILKKIWFKDQRHFGTFKLVDDKEFIKKYKKIGNDILASKENNNYLSEEKWIEICLKYSYYDISTLLMDQSKISGIGNYLRSEILYDAEIYPLSYIFDLNENDLIKIYKSIKKISKDNYLYQKYNGINFNFKVYMQNIDSNGFKIIKIKDKNNRMIHFVKEIQKEINN